LEKTHLKIFHPNPSQGAVNWENNQKNLGLNPILKKIFGVQNFFTPPQFFFPPKIFFLRAQKPKKNPFPFWKIFFKKTPKSPLPKKKKFFFVSLLKNSLLENFFSPLEEKTLRHFPSQNF
jgi:hypothetical protein